MSSSSAKKRPDSPPTSPLSERSSTEASKHSSLQLTKRQEQNRSAQRAFRERRARALKDMEGRIGRMETFIELMSHHSRKMSELSDDISKLKRMTESLSSTVEAMLVPSWSVPSDQVEVESVAGSQSARALAGALRSSSTDPTLIETEDLPD